MNHILVVKERERGDGVHVVISRINFTHITISVHRTKTPLEAIGTRKHYMAHHNRDSYEV